MARFLAVLLACVMLIMPMSGCQSAPPEESVLRESAETSVTEMAAGNFDGVYKRMNSACQRALSVDILQQAWDSVTDLVGAFQSQKETSCIINDAQITATVTCGFTAKEVLVSFGFDEKGKISGIWLKYGKLSEIPLASSDQFEEVAIEIGSGTADKLRGRLTLPKGIERPPVVVMVQGSGPHDMDETIGKAGNQPFRDLALGLAEQGIASIRFDKRTFDYPEQMAELGDTMTIEDEILHDVISAIEMAEVDPRVDNSRIYLLGHSLGGMLAPKLAFDNPSVKGLISMGGSLRGLEDIILDQTTASVRKSTLSAEAQQKQIDATIAEVEKVKALTEAKKGLSVLGQPSSYWLSLNRARGDQFAPKLEIPMLILQGQADFQVSVEKDFQSWRDLLGDRKGVTYWAYGGLNHLFFPTTGKMDTTDYDAVAHVEPQVITDIATWIQTGVLEK